MKTFKNRAAQGEIYFMRVAEIPTDNIEPVQPENQHYIVGHSETGHHHVMEATKDVRFYRDTKDPLSYYMEVDAPSILKHLRGFDTHEDVQVPAGKFRIRHQRQHDPLTEWRKVAD